MQPPANSHILKSQTVESLIISPATCSKFRKIKCLWHVNFIDLILWDGSCTIFRLQYTCFKKVHLLRFYSRKYCMYWREILSSFFFACFQSGGTRYLHSSRLVIVRTVVQEMQMRCTVSDLSLRPSSQEIWAFPGNTATLLIRPIFSTHWWRY